MVDAIDLDQLRFTRISPEAVIPLRRSVLWPGCSSDHPNVRLPEDDAGHHIGASLHGCRSGPVAVISLWTQHEPVSEPSTASQDQPAQNRPPLHETSSVAVRFDKFAVERDLQRRGIGSALLRHAFHFAQSNLSADVIWCTARLETIKYYRERGMIVCGPTFRKGPGQYRTPMRMVLKVKAVDDSEINFHRVTVKQTMHLRHVVLWPEHPVSHVRLPEDDDGYHYGAFVPQYSQPAAVISLFIERLPPTSPGSDAQTTVTDEDASVAVRFRKFACDPALQGRGIGTQLLKYVMDVARKELGVSAVWCDARTSSAEWYERRGMQAFGQTFLKGPIEYIRMKTI